MRWKPEGVGAEPKKLVLLGVLVLVAGYFYFSSSSSPEPVRRAPSAAATATPAALASRASRGSLDDANRDSLADWRPSVKRKKGFDPTKIDPTLKLALLDKVRQVPLEGGDRSLFDFSQEPVKEAVVKIADKGRKGMPSAPVMAVAPKLPPAHTAPVAPPIPLKFYGFVSAAAESKRAFFLDGDNIIVAAQGDVIKKRYKVVRIGINSAILEDEQFKSQQTLSLVQERQG